VCSLPLCGVPIDVLHLTISQLAINHQHLHEMILSSLWEGTVVTANIFMKNFVLIYIIL
jgi:hypothetical protein